MKITILLVAVLLSGVVGAQEPKPVPKNSVRVFVPGCSKGYVFTAGPRTEDQPGSSGLPEGMHLRMSGPKNLLTEIKAREGSMIEITGLVKKNDLSPGGMKIGPVRVGPGSTMSGGGSIPSPASSQIVIDVEGWRRVAGECPR